MDALEAVDHPQYRAYKASRDLADRYAVEWVPMGISDVEVRWYIYYTVCHICIYLRY